MDVIGRAARVVTIQPNIGEKRRVRDVNGTAKVVTIQPKKVRKGRSGTSMEQPESSPFNQM
jgi:hypothetical protein